MGLIFDSHSHYDSDRFDEDRHQVLTGLYEKGVGYVLNAGCDVKSSREVSRLCDQYPFLYGSAGVHPHEANEVTSDYLGQIEAILLQNDKMVAVGEIGLDYHYDFSPRAVQKRVFEEQLMLADRLHIPVIIHSREAAADTMELLHRYRPKGVVHCFSGSVQTAQQVLSLGMYIGFTGVITFSNARKILEVVDAVPVERMLIETDCPYMAPVPYRGERCDSSMLDKVVQKIAEIKQLSVQDVIDQTRKNAFTVFEISGAE